MQVAICHRAIVRHDAIGNDIVEMYRVLGDRASCLVYGEIVERAGLRVADPTEMRALLGDERNLVIYHHSIDWPEGEKLLAEARARVVIRYHNITLPKFFEPYHEAFYEACKAGREQTERLKALLPRALWMADSRFNLEEAGLNGARPTAVVPPLQTIERWADIRPDETLLRDLIESDRTNLLFVGRLSPNKNHATLLEMVADHLAYYDRPIRLHLVGTPLGPGDRYRPQLEALVRELAIEDAVSFTGQVEDPTLLAYYLGSDYFVCASDHEGFCVPLVEAQSLHLPVIAKRSSAVPETLGTEQLTLGGAPHELSAALDVVARNARYREWLVERGRANFEGRFTRARIAADFLAAIDHFLADAA